MSPLAIPTSVQTMKGRMRVHIPTRRRAAESPRDEAAARPPPNPNPNLPRTAVQRPPAAGYRFTNPPPSDMWSVDPQQWRKLWYPPPENDRTPYERMVGDIHVGIFPSGSTGPTCDIMARKSVNQNRDGTFYHLLFQQSTKGKFAEFGFATENGYQPTANNSRVVWDAQFATEDGTRGDLILTELDRVFNEYMNNPAPANTRFRDPGPTCHFDVDRHQWRIREQDDDDEPSLSMVNVGTFPKHRTHEQWSEAATVNVWAELAGEEKKLQLFLQDMSRVEFYHSEFGVATTSRLYAPTFENCAIRWRPDLRGLSTEERCARVKEELEGKAAYLGGRDFLLYNTSALG